MDGIVTLILGFILGAVVAVTAMFRFTAYLLKNDKEFRDAMHDIDTTEEVQNGIVKFFYGDEKE